MENFIADQNIFRMQDKSYLGPILFSTHLYVYRSPITRPMLNSIGLQGPVGIGVESVSNAFCLEHDAKGQ